jgi:hypothetical protein
MKAILIMALFAIPRLGFAQDFSVRAFDRNGKEFADTLGLIPPLVNVKITSGDQSKKFRFEKAEVILARQKARVATINVLSSNIDLRMMEAQTRPGDHLVINVFVEESVNEKVVKTHTRRRSIIFYPEKNNF